MWQPIIGCQCTQIKIQLIYLIFHHRFWSWSTILWLLCQHWSKISLQHLFSKVLYITVMKNFTLIRLGIACFQLQCLANPQKPQYNGGIIQNPELNDGLKGWTAFRGAKIEHRESSNNKYVVAHSRNQAHDSVSQKIYLQKEKHYTLSGKFCANSTLFLSPIVTIIYVNERSIRT